MAQQPGQTSADSLVGPLWHAFDDRFPLPSMLRVLVDEDVEAGTTAAFAPWVIKHIRNCFDGPGNYHMAGVVFRFADVIQSPQPLGGAQDPDARERTPWPS